MNKVYLLLGCNLGDRANNIQKAIELIIEKIGNIYSQSSLYESAAWGKLNQPNFYNQLIICKTNLQPIEILAKIFEIEKYFKRERIEKWGARTMDVDILFYNDSVINSLKLTIPHALLHKRKFALLPLCEVTESFIHPIIKKSMYELLLLCDDELKVSKINV